MQAKGILYHHFLGEYCASIGLEFASPDCALACLPYLPGFKVGEKHPETLVACLNSDQLAAFKAKLPKYRLEIEPCGFKHCKGQCRNADIDNVNHSVDVGASFTLEIPAVPLNQLALALA